MSDGDEDVKIVESTESSSQGKKLLEVQCPICLDTPSMLVVTPCGHIYCNECIFHALSSSMRATKTKGECSVCKTIVRYDKVRYLELKLRPPPSAVAIETEKAEKTSKKSATRKRKRAPTGETTRKRAGENTSSKEDAKAEEIYKEEKPEEHKPPAESPTRKKTEGKT